MSTGYFASLQQLKEILQDEGEDYEQCHLTVELEVKANAEATIVVIFCEPDEDDEESTRILEEFQVWFHNGTLLFGSYPAYGDRPIWINTNKPKKGEYTDYGS